MKCTCCDNFLTDQECSAKHKETKEYLDTCFTCLKETNIPYTYNPRLDHVRYFDDDWVEWEEEDALDLYSDDD